MVRCYVEDVRFFASEYASKIDVDGIKIRLDNLRSIVSGSLSHVKYVKKIKKWLNKGLITAVPSEINNICNDFNSITVNLSKQFGSPAKKFYELIVDALDYGIARKLYLDYVPLMGVKTCVYCNAQYAVTFEGRGKNKYAQFEIDHWKSKSKYPFLSISFYNFVPSCSSCNQHKGKQDLMYSMYCETSRARGDVEYDPFVFEVPDYCLSQFLNKFQTEQLKIRFKSRTGDADMEKDYERFHINEMYALFKEEAALAIKRFLFYSKAYRSQMANNFGSVFGDSLPYDEFVFGVSFRKEDALSRPLTKMIQDIKAQLESSIYV